MSHPRTGSQIREAYLAFFESKGHSRLPSDSLVPSNDPTLLFTGAGMNQFKDEFLGKGRDIKRATTSQKCLRVPDLENVGRTPRHHTFFEMLGNFSFGDYFKNEVIPWEWHFFTEVLGWDPGRFVCTVYQDDDEAFQIWKDAVGMPEERIYRFGEKENFWPSSAPSKGPNGVCGPCSEIYYDLEPGGALPDPTGLEDLPDRFLEVGNFVFTQFDRKDGGVLQPLPQKNIDVGLGLERIAAVAQDVPNNFETDIFAPVLEALQSGSGLTYGADSANDVRMRRIADHARAVFFCIADGATPGREGRGYVVRKILRRAVRDGIDLGYKQPFLAELLQPIQQSMVTAYPQLIEQQSTIQALCHAEEERFRDVYRRGIERLELHLDKLQQEGQSGGVFPGSLAFELHDTFGFPVDITEVVARDHGYELDQAEFQTAMESQRDRARASTEISGDVFTESLASRLASAKVPPTDFQGYSKDSLLTKVVALTFEGELVEKLAAGQKGAAILQQTSFYAEGGGQVGDCGQLSSPEASTLFDVQTTSAEDGYSLHHGTAKQDFTVGMPCVAEVNADARRSTERHHTATHLMHAALKQVLGTHVNQAGSQVSPQRLRFDYTHPEAPTKQQLRQIEDLVRLQVLRAASVDIKHTSLDAAKQSGVTALFGEKYGDDVRVVTVPEFSAELCGGTHVHNIGAIGNFILLSDRALAAGVRRMEAVAGLVADQVTRQTQDMVLSLEAELKSPEDRLLERVQALKIQLKEAKQAKQVALPSSQELAAEWAGLEDFAWKHFSDLDANALRGISDSLRNVGKLPKIVLFTGGNSKNVPFLFLCSKDSGAHAGKLAKELGKHLRGGGGGRPDFAQGKGSNGADLEQSVQAFASSLASKA
ncbi:MAG: alanine--tRNA ligase [Planctomycetes bacterium]|nr:alanine--tRNA ligase [Planctomycetota bacterium]